MDEGEGERDLNQAAQSIKDLLERTFLLGVGAAALTKDRIQTLVDEFVRRGQLSAEEGKGMVDDLMDRSKQQARSAVGKANSSLQGAYRDLGLATKRETEDIDLRLRQLEHRIRLLEAAIDATGAAGLPGE
jgi:polyhydroxyalkanoate synthesis regulator phasin